MPANRSEKKGPENNPCGRCRAMGLAFCKGHGGSSGGGDSDVSTNEKAASKLTPHALETLLLQNSAWKKPDELEQTFLFKDQNTLFIMTIDMENNQIIFSGHKNLTETQQTDLTEFLDAIVYELNAFKTELTQHDKSGESIQISRDKTTLTINCPSAKHYDAFVQRLVNKNMLPIHPSIELHRTHDNLKVEEHSKHYTSPTPFNINGPKPKQ